MASEHDILTLLRERIRLTAVAEHICEECDGPWTYRVKEGCLEEIAREIARLTGG